MLSLAGPSHLTGDEVEIFLNLLARLRKEQTGDELALSAGVWRATHNRWVKTRRIRRRSALAVLRKLKKLPGRESDERLERLLAAYYKARNRPARSRFLLRLAFWMTERLQSSSCQVTLLAAIPTVILLHERKTEIRLIAGEAPCYQVRDSLSDAVEFEGVIDSYCVLFIQQYMEWHKKKAESRKKIFNSEHKKFSSGQWSALS